MSADARPFVPSSDAVSSEGPSMPDISGGGGGGQAGAGSGTRNEHLSANQQQLGDRLYPKVNLIWLNVANISRFFLSFFFYFMFILNY